MKIVVDSKENIYKQVTEIYVNKINNNPNINLGLATGSSPLPLYDNLVNEYELGNVSFKDVRTFNLDEYCGLEKDSTHSYFHFMNKHLFSRVDIDLKNTHIPSGCESNVDYYNQLLEENRIDLQLLGIGSNGHIAFNEPGTDFSQKTHKIKLADKTIEDNSRFFTNIKDVPQEAITMGLSNIMDSKEIILIIIGDNKAKILKEIIEIEEPTEDIPATILKNHKNVTVFIDYEAGKYLKNIN